MHLSTVISPVSSTRGTKRWTKTWTQACLIISLSSLCVQGCASRAPSLRVLDTRAGYGNELDDEEVALYERNRRSQDSVLRQGGRRVATAYIYPHELPTRDYFWGAYVSLIIGESEVTFENPDETDDGPGITDTTKTKKHPRKASVK